MKMSPQVLLIFLLVTPSLFAQADSEEAAKAKVVALEKAWNQAYKAGDDKALGALLDDAVILVEDDCSV